MDKEKNERLYREVRFQQNSSRTLIKDASVFRLKRQHKNLESTEYAANLCQFLNQSRNVSNLTMGDLSNVLTGLESLPDHLMLCMMYLTILKCLILNMVNM